MLSKVLFLFTYVACSHAGYIGLYPEGHTATSYANVISNYEAPLYIAPATNGYGGHGEYGTYGGYGDQGYGGQHEVDYYAYPKYKYSYGVHDPHSGDHKSQAEERDGDVVKGYYTVDEPDGTKRIVHYTADDHNGFNAVVEKTGHAVHPVPVKVVVAEPIYAKAVIAGPAYGGYQYGY